MNGLNENEIHEIQNGLTFCYPDFPDCPGNWPLKWSAVAFRFWT